MVMFGGVGMQPQVDKLRRGVDILVATPGRLLDHHQQGTLDLSAVQFFVLDEADRMLDMGFIHDIKKVLALLPKKRQNLLFSATFSDEIKELADRLLNQPALIEVARRNAPAESVAQTVHPVGRERKKELLRHLILEGDWHQVLVFTRTKHGANKLTDWLNANGVTAMAIHGNKSQSARTKALAEFKTGELRVLVATDIAARGIDIEELPHVVNYEMPNVPEDYVHRIGRTGRAGANGEAISLVCLDEEEFLRDIERLIKRSIRRASVPGFEPPAGERAEPIVLGHRMTIGAGAGGRGGRGGGRGMGRPGAGGGAGPRRDGGRDSRGGLAGHGSGRGGPRTDRAGDRYERPIPPDTQRDPRGIHLAGDTRRDDHRSERGGHRSAAHIDLPLDLPAAPRRDGGHHGHGHAQGSPRSGSPAARPTRPADARGPGGPGRRGPGGPRPVRPR